MGLPDSTLIKLKVNKTAIDKYIAGHSKNLIVLVKVPGKKNLIRVINEKWPDEVECTYNIMTGQSGKVIFIDKVPYSESGDWNVEYKHYFDVDGNTYSFSKEESVFDDGVKGGVVRFMLLKYYERNFKTLNEIIRLTDKDGKLIKRDKADFDFPDYKYTIYNNVDACLNGYGINATQFLRPL